MMKRRDELSWLAAGLLLRWPWGQKLREVRQKGRCKSGSSRETEQKGTWALLNHRHDQKGLFEGSTASHVNQPDQHVCSIPPHSCAPLAGCFHFAVLLKRRYAKCLKKTPKAGGEINLTVLKIFSFGLNRHMNPHLFGVNKGGVFCLKGNLSQEHRWSPALRFVLLFFLIIDFTYWCETAKRNTRSSAWGWKQEVWSWFRAAGVNVTGRGRREICGDITQGPCVKPVSVQTEIILLVLIHSYRHNWGLLSLEH